MLLECGEGSFKDGEPSSMCSHYFDYSEVGCASGRVALGLFWEV